MKNIFFLLAIIAVAISANAQVTTTFPTNNVARTSIPKPDLIIVSAKVELQDSILQNGIWMRRFLIRYTIKNQGEVEVDPNKFFVEGKLGAASMCGTVASSVLYHRIAAGATLDCIFGCSININTLVNCPLYTLTLDTYNQIAERNENNNYVVIALPSSR